MIKLPDNYELFEESKKIAHLGIKVKTPFGFQTVEYIHKTKPLPALEIIHQHGAIKVAELHSFIVKRKEIAAMDLKVGDFLETELGLSEIQEIRPCEPTKLYDISLDQFEMENEWYYANGVLSHNSGKSITVACYLVWLFNFWETRNIGIVANRKPQAAEFLKNVKNIFSRMPMWMMCGLTEWNKTSIENENETRVLTDAPTGDAFRGFTIHCLTIDECAFIKTQAWEEFADSVFPSQSALAWKKNIIISTANGLNHFYEAVEKAKNSVLARKLGEKTTTGFVEVDWREVPRYSSGGVLITPEEFRDGVIRKHGRAYFEQNYGNSFLGSAETLLNTEILESMETSEVVENWAGLNVYELPQPGKTYIMGVDAAKDGKDGFAVQIFDVSTFPFKQVASADLQVDYLEMPEFLYEWGAEFNSALMIVENNEGAGQSVADTLVNHYEYPNIHYDTGKKYPGFRTTVKSRDAILKLLQILGNSGKLQIRDKGTVDQLMKFELVNGKYQASTGRDDLVMALALCISPLAKFDNFEDFGLFLKTLRTDEEIETNQFLVNLNAMSFADV